MPIHWYGIVITLEKLAYEFYVWNCSSWILKWSFLVAYVCAVIDGHLDRSRWELFHVHHCCYGENRQFMSSSSTLSTCSSDALMTVGLYRWGAWWVGFVSAGTPKPEVTQVHHANRHWWTTIVPTNIKCTIIISNLHINISTVSYD